MYGSSAGAINATYFLSAQRDGVDIYTRGHRQRALSSTCGRLCQRGQRASAQRGLPGHACWHAPWPWAACMPCNACGAELRPLLQRRSDHLLCSGLCVDRHSEMADAAVCGLLFQSPATAYVMFTIADACAAVQPPRWTWTSCWRIIRDRSAAGLGRGAGLGRAR